MSSQHPTAVLRPAPLRNHRRESSISTSASSSSSHTRVLACAPATRPRFAVVAARRVGAGTRAAGRPPLSLAALLPPTARARPIIGLGVTLNPADAVVRLQPRHATQPLGSLPSRPPPVPRSVSCSRAACEPPPPSPDPRFADPLPVPLLPPSAAKPRRVPAAPAQWLEPPAALSPAEPAPADPPLPPQPTEPPPAKTLERPAPPARATAEVTCLLCFERVLVARRRGHALRCPSCLNALNLRGAGFVLMARGLLHALGELCTGRSRPAAADSDDGLLRRMARSSIHIMQPLHARRDDGTTRPAPTPRRSTECPRSHSRRLRSPARRLLHRSRRHTTTAPSLSPVPPQPTTTPIKSQHHRLPITRPIPGKSCSSAGSSIHRTRKRGTTAASPTARRSLLVPHMPSIPSQLPLPVALELPAAAPLIPPLHSASAMPFPTTMSPLPLPPPPPQISSAHSSGTYTNADVVHSLSAERCSPESARTLSAGTPAGNACCDIPAAMPERCATHPGSRNDLWCASCDAAVCRHCVAAASGAHSAHAVVTLAAAYDDTFEAVDSLQLQLVRHLAETRQRNAELDAAAMALAEDCAAAHAAADEQLARDAARIEVARARADADLSRQAADCAAWRAGLEAALGDVQRMVDELPPLQAVAQRARMVQMLTAAARARPPAWAAESAEPPERLVALVEPAWVHSELHVPAVAELGRRRGHVRVAGERFTAHGAVWQAEARRSRNRLGEPSLAVSVRCVEGGGCAYAVTAGIDALALAVAHSGAWARDASHDFALCLLDDLVPALAADGAVAVRIGVRAEDFQGLALAQAARIAQLEERVRVLELDASQTRGTPGGGSCSRRRSEARGWATSPRAPPVPQIPLPAPPPMQLPATQSSAHRRAASLTAAKLRRQPPIPFPIGASHSTQPSSTAADSALTSTSPTGSRIKSTFFSTSPPGSVCSRDSASAASASAAPGVLRRLSGWPRRTGATCDLGLSAQPPNCRSPRRAVTMDANDLCRAVARSDAAEPLHAPFEPLHAPSRPRPRRDSSVPPSRRMSITSVSSSASSSAGGRLSGRITRPGGATARRGSGAGSGSEAAAAPLLPMLGLSPARGPSSQQQQQQQLTPRANRQGGILKAGRTMRAKPTRLHPLAELPLTAASAVSERVLSTPGSPVLALIPDVSDDEFVFSSSGGGTSAALGAPVPRAGGRPVRTPRKSVRFPEEQRLLETIRLIDPRAAQTIESRAARPASVYLRPPPPAPLLRHQYDDVSGDEDAPLSGLAARIRYSPRLAPRSAPLAAPTSPDLFGADAALVLDDIAEHNLDADDISLAAPLFNTRPPLPPTQQQLRASSRVDNEYN
ncbi:hypothetical protein GGI02_003141, partial [Coemansia sp. RSA 2322]